ncbi:MAG: Hpt domain-containing protein [Desulfovibrionaceae bacterium]|nr:Hpt domain-containing protein [Desulfovibrionaceae bacterium]
MRRGDPVVEVFLEETAERLDSIEAGLLKLEQCDGACDAEAVNAIFRDAHSVKAGSNLLKLNNIEKLSHKLENVLEMIRKGRIGPTETVITACLEAVDKLRDLRERIEHSDAVSIRLHTAMLEAALREARKGD